MLPFYKYPVAIGAILGLTKIQPGKMLYEMEGVNEEVARQAFRLAAAKLPFNTNFVIRQVM